MARPDISRAEIVDGLRQCSIFVDWPVAQLEALAQSARIANHPRGTLLADAGRGPREVLVIVSGWVEIMSANVTGEKFILSAMGAGQVAKLLHLLGDVPMSFSCYAREDVRIIHIPEEAMTRLLDSEPILWKSLALLLLRRYHFSIGLLESQALGSARRRVAAMLITLACRTGADKLDAYETDLKLSQTELADMLGLSRQTVAKELEQMKREKLLGDSGYRSITLLNVPELLRLAKD